MTKIVILDTKSTMNLFLNKLSAEILITQTIDVSAALSIIFEAFGKNGEDSDYVRYEKNLESLVREMAFGDRMLENNVLDETQKQLLEKELMSLGCIIHSIMDMLGILDLDEMPFTFEGLLIDKSIVLKKRTNS